MIATPRLTSYNLMTHAIIQDAIQSDPDYEAVMKHDVLRGKTIAKVASQSHLKWLIIVSQHDHLVYAGPALEWAKAAKAETYISDTPFGHLMLDCDAAALSQRIQAFHASNTQ